MARYQIAGGWDEADRQTVYGGSGAVVLRIETADLVETTSGRRYVQGAYRVSASRAVMVGDNKPVRSKTFKGETAWMDAERLQRDMAMAIQLGRG